MGLFDLFRSRPKNTASVAAERLRIIVMQERKADGRGGHDYLPTMRREILEVIRKYVNVDADAIDIHVTREGEDEVLELSVTLPERDRDAGAERGRADEASSGAD
ncbi:MAG: cell division topological specificity factor MinE [Dokdonella sp.]|uniref:cell division topological specificity factor MinE n=1 Tax=Dokdonella sp. TaxID=2291710 RepID=UPI0025BE2EBC|nr:cell division topological specificity factor MinE [Dokdonella sp.]MBX3699392.1 cell division topological specificity factor MinE [Dokdonella sp.]